MNSRIYMTMRVDEPVRGLFSKRRRQRVKSYRKLLRLWRERY